MNYFGRNTDHVIPSTSVIVPTHRYMERSASRSPGVGGSTETVHRSAPYSSASLKREARSRFRGARPHHRGVGLEDARYGSATSGGTRAMANVSNT
jgi:hypothetical protein